MQSPVRAALLQGLAETSGLHPTSLHRLTDLFAAAWSRPDLDRLWQRGLGHLDGGFAPLGTVGVVAPGNLPVATWQAMLEPLLCGNRVRVRPGSGDPLAPGNLRAALAMVAPDLAAAIEVVAFDHNDRAGWQAMCKGLDALTVQGSDAAVAAVLQRCGEVGFVGRLRSHGHLQSLALVTAAAFADAEKWRAVAQGLAHDALLADGRGCMALRAVLVLGEHDPARWLAAHEDLASALATVAVALPAGQGAPRPAQVLARETAAFAAATEPNSAAFTAGGDWWLGSSWAPGGLQPEAGPGGRGLVLRSTAGADFSALQGTVSTVALARPETEALPGALTNLRPHRLCRPGAMQAPPADRAPDGHLPLLAFVRVLACFEA